MENLQKRFTDYIKRTGLVDAGSCKNIIAGISGGADSVCLLLLLKEEFEKDGIKITAVHINHNLRAEAKDDEKFVRNLCRDLGIELRVFSEDVRGLSEKEGLSMEEAGRIIRYERFLNTAIEAVGDENLESVKIAVAHHMNDNAETIIFNMLRGSNLSGIAGIRPKQEKNGIEIIRPLLFATREEIEEFLNERHQAFVTDKTNADTDIARNKIRHDIVPAMKEINTSAVRHIVAAAESVSEAEIFLKKKTDELYEYAVSAANGEIFVDTEKCAGADEILVYRIIYTAVGIIRGSLRDITRIHVENVWGLKDNESGKRISLPGGIIAVKEGKNIVLKKLTEKEAFQVVFNKKKALEGCKYDLPDGRHAEFQVIDVTDLNRNEIIKKNECTKVFDYDKISDSIFLGTRTEEDKIRLQKGIKTLSRFFIDQKIPSDRTEDFMVLKDEEEVIWVLGLRISEKYKITDTTKRALQVSITGGCYGQN